MEHRVLVASPVRQKESILAEFFQSLELLDTSGLTLDFAFIDDNNEHDLLLKFSSNKENARIFPGNPENPYYCNETRHYWQEGLMWKVAAYKDQFIKLALEEGYDYLFLVDSDLYLQPPTLNHLISLGKDIVSEVFWTKWQPGQIPLPQVWVTDQYQLYHTQRGEDVSNEEGNKRTAEFLHMLAKPGTYKVGMLGACTLISRRALALGVAFREIYNLNLMGEDRHFCIRAAALGLELYADTHYPPFHIYRESELQDLQEYKRQKCITAEKGRRITLAMLVSNESDRYLESVLKHAVQYIDAAVILDDASDDNTVEICQTILQDVPLTLVSNPEPGFHNEIILRKQLWEMAAATGPDWILLLDADEVFEDKAPAVLRELAAHSDIYHYSFRLYDMWAENSYREDTYWSAHKVYRPFMVRYVPGFNYLWQETPQHCGRLPKNIYELPGETSQLRIKHLGWLKPEDRLAKYKRYQRLDPGAIYGIREQYESILNPQPHLILWEEGLGESSRQPQADTPKAIPDASAALWDKIWQNPISEWDPLSEQIYHTIKQEVKALRGKKILEAGSGSGRISLKLALEGAEVSLLDYSDKALEAAQTLFAKYQLPAKYIKADLREPLPFADNEFDLVWNAGVMEHFLEDEQLAITKELARISPEFHTFNPYAKSIFYTLGKWIAEQNGSWIYGKEYPVSSMKDVFRNSGFQLKEEYSIVHLNSLDFLEFIPGGSNVKNAMSLYLQSLSESGRKEVFNLLGGYLLYSKGVKIN
ncbi:hypothetical protein JCM15765_14120 [Paradesulfitobacterium aromaticivorans]